MALIYETLVTTLGADGNAHIAPMGIREEQDLVILAPFQPSTTLNNLRERPQAVINFTDDVRVFAGCLTGRREWPLRPADLIAGHVLESNLAHRELVVERVEEDELRPRFYCRTVFNASHKPFLGFNRAQAAVIEAAVLVSRLAMLPVTKIEQEIAYLTIAIAKTAGPREQEAWQWLMQAIADFKADQAKVGER